MYIPDSRAHIAGSVERHVNEGSRLSLVCRIESPSAPPSYVYWYRDGDVVNYSNKEGVNIRFVRLKWMYICLNTCLVGEPSRSNYDCLYQPEETTK